ncbi:MULTISPECIES: type II toxin-antitoxin system CcdA family antitoxin [unclassified Erwinia]|uniref:type II toxin-antitoxin system CcdA family antitoxin n=1 Tax=unclassified Erwinia TaxID=2622719 RepID=UPI0006F9F572|nr:MULTISPECIES: type II toxin-antitoxin system CcdA family antitoxin [unclassified Erwinia]KQN53751.1 antitoxin [Erwinia sp. Leaf53]PLV57834.1 antitoxin [Erwinia sp. B116]
MSTSSATQKKTVSVTLDPALYDEARRAGINLSATLATALLSELRATAARRWQQENQQGLDELNRITEENGLLSDRYRAF